jgi:polysaccharide deacetylase 2 family uncharacterized protein YibQ
VIFIKKGRGGRKGKTIKKKLRVFSFAGLAGLFVLVGFLGFLFYLFRTSGPPVGVPAFETYPSRGTEAIVKHLDRQIYDTLLKLGVRAEQVAFNTVETKRRGSDEWTFSDLDVRLKKTRPRKHIKKAFVGGLSSVTPKPSVRVSAGANNGTVIEISVEGNPTHRLHIFSSPKRIPAPSAQSRRPLVAIIIDDMGYDYAMASKFLKLNSPFSFSVIPNSPFQKEIASSAHESGRDVLLHLPMEPSEYPDVNPGEGALLSSMTPDELLGQLERNLNAVPFVVGVNNHMGSKLTQDASKMRQVFTILKRRNLFFVDSFTSPGSRCAQAAKLLGLKFARRQVFLDHVQDTHAIRFQIKRLISVANKKGAAIGIAHPHPVTWRVLKEDLQQINSQVEIVRVSLLAE